MNRFDFLFENADDREKKYLVHSLIDKIQSISKFDYTIKYKNLGILGWKLQDEIHITTDKRSITSKEIQIILKDQIG